MEQMTSYDVKRLALILAEQTRVEAMKAENVERARRDMSPAYGETAFFEAAERIQHLGDASDFHLFEAEQYNDSARTLHEQ